jgi:hypothetical protein
MTQPTILSQLAQGQPIECSDCHGTVPPQYAAYLLERYTDTSLHLGSICCQPCHVARMEAGRARSAERRRLCY